MEWQITTKKNYEEKLRRSLWEKFNENFSQLCYNADAYRRRTLFLFCTSLPLMAYNNIHTRRFEYDGFSVLPPYYMTHIALGSLLYSSNINNY